MAETSMFWDGTTLGDATTAPYSATEIATALNNVLGSFVIPYTYADNPGGELEVTSSAAVGKVTVGPGAAFVKGILYTSDEYEDVSIASNAAGNPRIDRVILQRDTVAQTVRLAVLQGVAAAAPALPALDTANEFPLFFVYVANGYDAALNNISDIDIHDERVFKETGPAQHLNSRHNLIRNAEFLGVTSSAAANAFPNWKLVAAPSIAFNTGTFRGRSLVITGATNGQGIETTVQMNRNHVSEYPVYTIYFGKFNCTAGDTLIRVYGVNLTTGASSLLITKSIHPYDTAALKKYYIRLCFKTAATYDAIRISTVSQSVAANDILLIGEPSITYGYTPTIAYNHEIIWLDEAMTDAAWSASAKSTGATAISLVASFGAVFPPYMRGVILRARCRDSASAAAVAGTDTSLSFYHKNIAAFPQYTYASALVSCAGRANDTWEEQVVYVPLDHTDATATFDVYVTASGAGTLDATIEVLGLVT